MWHQWFNRKLWHYEETFVSKENLNKKTTFNNLFSFVYSSPRKPQACFVVLSWIDTEEKKLFNKIVIFVYFAYKKFSCTFIKLMLNHWYHMDYFNYVITSFLGLELGISI